MERGELDGDEACKALGKKVADNGGPEKARAIVVQVLIRSTGPGERGTKSKMRSLALSDHARARDGEGCR